METSYRRLSQKIQGQLFDYNMTLKPSDVDEERETYNHNLRLKQTSFESLKIVVNYSIPKKRSRCTFIKKSNYN